MNLLLCFVTRACSDMHNGLRPWAQCPNHHAPPLADFGSVLRLRPQRAHNRCPPWTALCTTAFEESAGIPEARGLGIPQPSREATPGGWASADRIESAILRALGGMGSHLPDRCGRS